MHAVISSDALGSETSQDIGSVHMCLSLTCALKSVWSFLQLLFFRAVYAGKYLLPKEHMSLMYQVQGVQKREFVGECLSTRGMK